MEQQTEPKAREDGLSEQFKQKISAWEKAGVFDRLAARIEEAAEGDDAK